MANIMNRGSNELFHPLLESFFNAPLGGRALGTLLRAPEADVVETETEIRVCVEMPGMRPDDIEIGLENNVLTIGGEKNEERDEGAAEHLAPFGAALREILALLPSAP